MTHRDTEYPSPAFHQLVPTLHLLAALGEYAVMKPIFMYLKECKLSDRQLRKLTDAGYVTLPVDSFDSVRIAEPLLMGSNPIAKAAYEAIANSGYSSIPEKFGRRVAQALISGNENQ